MSIISCRDFDPLCCRRKPRSSWPWRSRAPELCPRGSSSRSTAARTPRPWRRRRTARTAGRCCPWTTRRCARPPGAAPWRSRLCRAAEASAAGGGPARSAARRRPPSAPPRRRTPARGTRAAAASRVSTPSVASFPPRSKPAGFAIPVIPCMLCSGSFWPSR